MAVDTASIVQMWRQAYKHAISPLFIDNDDYVMGGRKSFTLPAKRGDQTLCAIGLVPSLAVSGGTVTATAASMIEVMKQIEVRVDGNIVVESSSAVALKAMLQQFLDRPISDTILSAAGTGTAYVVLPVSGRNGVNVAIDIDFASFSDMYSAGTEGAKVIKVYAIYSPIESPTFDLWGASQTYSGTGNKIVDLDGAYKERGIPSMLDIIGDGTVVIDDVSYQDANGKALIDGKYTEIKALENMRNIQALGTYEAIYFLDATIPVSDRDQFRLDITHTGTVYVGGLFAFEVPSLTAPNSSAATPSPNRNAPMPNEGRVPNATPAARPVPAVVS